jgi:hypothetical protein
MTGKSRTKTVLFFCKIKGIVKICRVLANSKGASTEFRGPVIKPTGNALANVPVSKSSIYVAPRLIQHNHQLISVQVYLALYQVVLTGLGSYRRRKTQAVQQQKLQKYRIL